MIDGVQYLVWAQKDPAIEGNSNLYIAKMANPWTLGSEPVMLTKPEYGLGMHRLPGQRRTGLLFHENKIYITYSASGTGVPYAVGLLTAERGSDLLDKASWTKSPVPVFKTCAENGQYGPGHNSFTKSEDGTED